MDLFTPKEYLAISIANSFGLDKQTWQARLSWFQDNEERLETLVDQAKEPAQYMAGLIALQDVLDGKPIGHMISLDATSSGCQLLSVLSQDRISASRCNVIDTGNREDAYQGLYKLLQDEYGVTEVITPAQAKQAVMTALYSSREVPARVFGSEVHKFWDALAKFLPGAWSLNQAFLSLQDSTRTEFSWILPDNFHVQFKVKGTTAVPFRFKGEEYTAHIKTIAPKAMDRSIGANVIHSVDGYINREMVARCNYDPEQVKKVQHILFTAWDAPMHIEDSEENKTVLQLQMLYQKTGVMSARILQYINEENVFLVEREKILELINSLPEKPFQVLSLHDCFKVLPNYGNDLRIQYNTILASLANSRITAYLINSIAKAKVFDNTGDPEFAKDIMNANYSLS